MPRGLDRESHIPYFAQIEGLLRDQVETGTLLPGSRMPSEIELAADFEVSRMTARRAIDRLAEEGVVVRRPRIGTFVGPRPIVHPLSTSTSLSAALEAIGVHVRTKVLVADRVSAPARIARELATAPGEPVVRIRRLRLIEDEVIAIHETNLAIRYAGVLARDMTGSLTEAMRLEGIEVATARDAVEARAATAEESEIMGLTLGDPVLWVEGRAVDRTGAPIRFTTSTYRGDRFKIVVDTSTPTELRVEVAHENGNGTSALT